MFIGVMEFSLNVAYINIQIGILLKKGVRSTLCTILVFFHILFWSNDIHFQIVNVEEKLRRGRGGVGGNKCIISIKTIEKFKLFKYFTPFFYVFHLQFYLLRT